jgi:hypothetical protein
MKQFTIFSLFATALIALAGCSYDGTSTMPAPTKVTYTKGTTYTYYEEKIDSNDAPVQGSGDTVTSRVVIADTTYLGKTHVTILVNSHSNGTADDSTFIAQDSGNFWHYNYGLESANTNQSILSFNNGKPIVTGWVLQGKMEAASGTKWAANTKSVVNIGSLGAAFADTAVEQSDANINVNGTNVVTKHAVHNVQVSSSFPVAASVKGIADTYISANYGVVKNIVHSAKVSLGTGELQAQGTQTFLLRKN